MRLGIRLARLGPGEHKRAGALCKLVLTALVTLPFLAAVDIAEPALGLRACRVR